MGTLTVITQPTVEPVTLEDAKKALGVDHDDDDLRIEGYLQAARHYAEAYLSLKIPSQVIERSYDAWPSSAFNLDVWPIQSIDSVIYDDTGSPVTAQTLVLNTDYYADTTTVGGRITTISGWPSTAIKPNPIRVRMTAGYATPDDVPMNIREGIKAYVVYLYEQNCDMDQVARNILWPARRL